ncbi:MAG: SPOR domain-containing protein [Pontibacterium sp.]
MDLLKSKDFVKRSLIVTVLSLGFPSFAIADAPCDLLFSLGLFDRAEAQCEIEAQQGSSTAAMHLASIYTAAKQPSRAIVWLKKASDGGNVKAQYNLGYAYQHGVGVPASRDEAKHYYSLAADGKHYDAGLLHAQMLLEEGHNNPAINRLEAMLPLFNSTKQQADISYLLGVAFLPTNTEQAVENFHSSADGGTRHGYSAYNLAKLYLSGESVPFDQEKGMYYANMAEQSGVGEARNLVPDAPVSSVTEPPPTANDQTPDSVDPAQPLTEPAADPTTGAIAAIDNSQNNADENSGELSDEILAELAATQTPATPAPPAPKPVARTPKPVAVVAQTPTPATPKAIKPKPSPPVAPKAVPTAKARPAHRAESHILPDRTDNQFAGGVHNFERFPRNRYTLQVGIFKTTDAAKQFVHSHSLSPAYIHPTRYKGNPAFILLVGNFQGQGQALQATANLPPAVAARGSIARSFRRIRELWPAP